MVKHFVRFLRDILFGQRRKVENLDPLHFFRQLSENDQTVLLDVRSPVEVAQSKIEGALNIDILNANFHSEIEKLDRSKNYFVYCKSGRRSKQACKLMNRIGISNTVNLKGGILAWEAANLPVMLS